MSEPPAHAALTDSAAERALAWEVPTVPEPPRVFEPAPVDPEWPPYFWDANAERFVRWNL